MKYLNFAAIANQSVNQASIASAAIDLSQILKMSAQAVVSSGGVSGTLQLQVSNDPCPYNYAANAVPFVPTNWSNLGSAVTISTSGISLIAQQDLCYKWLRALFTDTAALVNTITTVADQGILEASTITTVADVASSLNNTYFTFSLAKNSVNYYVWFNVSGAGTDPALAGKTGIQVAITAGDADTVVATALRAALTTATGANATITGATNQAIITNKAFANVTNTADGAVPTGFNFVNVQGHTSNLNSSYFTVQSGTGVSYYVWFNVGTLGVDPAVPGKTGIAVALTASANANAVATAIRAATIAGITITGATNQAILTNDVAGPATPAADGTAATGFTFGNTVPAATIAVNLMCLSI